MTTLVSDYTSPNFNSYLTLEEADDFANSRLYSENYLSSTLEKKIVALIQSSQLLDSLKWRGVKTDVSQPKAFPRTDLYNLDGVAVSADIPSWLKRATLEVAVNILSKDPNHVSLNKLQIEGLSVSRNNTSSNRNWYTSAVKQIVSQYVSNPYSVQTVRV